jgi:hypothetical protein
VLTLEIGHSFRSYSITGDDLVQNRSVVQSHVVYITAGEARSVGFSLRNKKNANRGRESGDQVIAQGNKKSRLSGSVPCKSRLRDVNV